MPRRISLAAALALTTVVTFALIAIGSQAGVFSESKPSSADAAASAPPAGVPSAPPVPGAPTTAPTRAAPQVIVQTDYVDVIDAPAPSNAPGETPANGMTPATEATPSASAAATRTPLATATARATATAPANATATAANPATAAPPAPMSTPSSLPKEIEFVGTVTAIDGNQVTFNHGGSLTTVQVSNPGALSIGDTAHVHALLKSTGYVATEVQVGG
jgi:hypothetical protein